MRIAAFASRQVDTCNAQAQRWREEARQNRIRADAALARGDREAHTRWNRQADMCDGWARESKEAADQFFAILQAAGQP